jgi:ribonuclease D
MEATTTETAINGIVVWDDIDRAFLNRATRAGEIGLDIETDRCDFSDPSYFEQVSPRIITVHIWKTNESRVVRVTMGSNPALLRQLLGNVRVTTYLHYAMFDLTFLEFWFEIVAANVKCTYSLARAVDAVELLPTGMSSLKHLLPHFGIADYETNEAVSDWTADVLSEEQVSYALMDVVHLKNLHTILSGMLEVFDADYENEVDYLPKVSAYERALPAMVAMRAAGVTKLVKQGF